MMLDEVAAYITTNSTSFTAGGTTGNMGKGQMDDTQPATFVGLFHNPGSGPMHAFSTGNMTERLYEQPMLQVLSRSTSLATALLNAYKLHSLLDGVSNTTMTGVRFLSIQALQNPGYIGHDENRRFLVSANYRVKRETT